MKKTALTTFLLLSVHLLTAGNPTDPKTFVSGKDVFGTRNFIENKGQFDKDLNGDYKIEAVLNHGSEKIYFTNKGLVYELIKRFPLNEEQREAMEHGKEMKVKPPKIYHVNMNWLNANANISIEKSDKQSHYFTYGEAKYNSYVYKKLTYKNVYPNIDIEYTIPEDKDYGVKYNVIVHPGANVNDIKIAYTGDVDKIKQTQDGNILIKTPLEDITEHVPKSFYEEGTVVESAFSLNKDVIGFSLPKDYDQNKTIIIDPWVSSITTLGSIGSNGAYDVDYDNNGNVFAFGGDSPYKVACFNSVGILQWTFSGTILTPVWSSDPAGFNIPGNFTVNKTDGTIYVSSGIDPNGAQIVRLDVFGNYNNFISIQNPSFQEIWDMDFHCSTGEVFSFGASTTTSLSLAIFNPTAATANFSNFQPSNSIICQDIISYAVDDGGNLFVIYASAANAILNNAICSVNLNFNGNNWTQSSTFNAFTEAANKFFYQGINFINGQSNGFNSLAVNNNYLFYYDGLNLAAYNKATGVVLASTIIPLNVLEQGGIAVDDCNNVYVGGNGSILSYNFNGTSFILLPSISLGLTGTFQHIFDIKLDKLSNLLYVGGSDFVGVYSAINSTTCSNISSVQLSVTPGCIGTINGNGIATASLTATGLLNPLISYTWTNASGSVIAQTNSSALLTNTLNNLVNGNYTVYAQINAPCGSVFSQTFSINCSCANVNVAASSSCVSSGVSASLSLISVLGFSSSPLTYSWTGPGGFSSSIVNQLLPSASIGIYTLTVTSPSCVASGTLEVKIPSVFNPAIINTSVACFNGSNGTASVSTINGSSTPPYTYLWSNMQTAVQALSLTAGSYTCLVTDALGCTYSATTNLQQSPPAYLTLVNSSVTCNNGTDGSASVAAVPISNTGPYTYTWSSNPVQNSAIASGLSAGTYSCTLKDNIGCIFTGTTSLTQPSSVSVTISSNITQACAGTPISLTAGGSGGTGSAYTYSWSAGGSGFNTAVSQTLAGIYNYSVTAYDINSCSASATKTLKFLASPAIEVSDTAICFGQSVNLTASGALNYTWSPAIELNSAFGNNVIAKPTKTTIYTIFGSDQVCLGSKNITLTVVNYPNLQTSCSSQEICHGNGTELFASGAQYYVWYPTSIYTSNLQTNAFVAPLTSSEYTIVGYNAYQTTTCSVQQMLPVVVVKKTFPSISQSKAICLGETVSLSVSGGNVYNWLPSAGLNATNLPKVIASPSISTVYTVDVSYRDNCGNRTATVNINVNPLPMIYLVADSTFVNCNYQYQISAISDPLITKYEWYVNSDFKSNADELYISLGQGTQSVITLEVTNQYGCINEAKKIIKTDNLFADLIYVPNSFSPNDDGLNDTWRIMGDCFEMQACYIYNRWGELIYTLKNNTDTWDGSYKGTTVKDGVYNYKIIGKLYNSGNVFEKTGVITVLK